MKATIYNYTNKPTIIEITKEVVNAVLLLMIGDQVLFLKYKYGDEEEFECYFQSIDDEEEFDSSSDRFHSFYDGCWFVKLHDGIDFREYKNG